MSALHRITANFTHMTMRSTTPAAALMGGVLDAVQGAAILLDPSGTVLAGNRHANARHSCDGQPIETVLDALATLASADTALALAGVRAVLEGAQRSFTLDVSTTGEPPQRIVLRVTGLDAEAGGGAVVQLGAALFSGSDGTVDRRQDMSFRPMFAASLDAMLITDAGGMVISGNPAAHRLMGRDEAQLAGMAFGDLFTPGARTAAAGDAWQRLMRDGQWRGEGRLLVGDMMRVLDIAGSAHIMPGRHLITVRDITESQQLEAQLRQAQKMEAIGLLTGGMAHDFNNLLTVVLANADLVMESLPHEMEEVRDEVSQMIQAATRGTDMVRKLLAFSRRESLERRPVSLEVVLAETQALLARLLPSNITLVTEATPDLPGIHADPGAVQHMLINLATNARDAMPTGGTLTMRGAFDPAVEMPDGVTSPMVTITVQDSGRGMDDEVLAHLFEPFFTTKGPGEGTGLGMAMIYGLVQQHAGTIDVQSTVGRGTTVIIALPIADLRVASPTPRATTLVREGATETILLVEDEEMVRRAGRRILEKHGYRVLLAGDGAEALTLLRQHGSEIALVVSDVVMPRMGGRELYASLRDEGFTMPFLFTSGYTDRMSSDTVALDPSVPILPKPWTWAELTASVRAALDAG